MSKLQMIPFPHNSWQKFSDAYDEDEIEALEIAYEEELKQIFSQEINQNIVGMEMKDEEEEDEADEVDDMEEYTEDMQMQEI